MIRRTVPFATALLVPAAVCIAGEPGKAPDELTIGDKAPALEISHWVKGEPIETFQKGNVYVVEFWATWCGPCRASMPHLTELQEEYRDYDVTIVGVSDEKLQTVVDFLTKTDSEDVLWNDKIEYTLATDPDNSTHTAYMKAAAQRGIPTAFVVGKNARIEWIGHPMQMDEVLGQVVRDRWDRTDFKTEFEEKVAVVRETMRMMEKVETAADKGDWDTAIAVVDKLVEDQPGQAYAKATLFRRMLHEADDADRIYAYGRRVMSEHDENADILNQLAWFTVDDPEVEVRDLDFAHEAAKRANELTDSENPAILDTLARVYYEKGDLKAAIKWQRLAVEESDGDGLADQLRETLIKYERMASSQL